MAKMKIKLVQEAYPETGGRRGWLWIDDHMAASGYITDKAENFDEDEEADVHVEWDYKEDFDPDHDDYGDACDWDHPDRIYNDLGHELDTDDYEIIWD